MLDAKLIARFAHEQYVTAKMDRIRCRVSLPDISRDIPCRPSPALVEEARRSEIEYANQLLLRRFNQEAVATMHHLMAMVGKGCDAKQLLQEAFDAIDRLRETVPQVEEGQPLELLREA